MTTGHVFLPLLGALPCPVQSPCSASVSGSCSVGKGRHVTCWWSLLALGPAAPDSRPAAYLQCDLTRTLSLLDIGFCGTWW